MALLGLPLTFYWVSLAWIFFRADTFDKAFTMLKAFVLFDSPGSRALPATLLYMVVPLAALHWLSSRKSIHLRVERLPNWACAVGYGVAVFLTGSISIFMVRAVA